MRSGASPECTKMKLASHRTSVGPFSGTWPLRVAAAQALGELNDLRTAEPLIGLLSDQDRYIRNYAVVALGGLGAQGSIAPRVKLFAANNVWSRPNEVSALYSAGAPIDSLAFGADALVLELLLQGLGDAVYTDYHRVAATLLGEAGTLRCLH